MRLVRTQMRVASRHRQTLLPQQVCNAANRTTLHSKATRKCMPQVVPTKVLDLRLNHRVVEPMPPIFERFSSLGRLEHTPSPVAQAVHNPEGSKRSIIQGDV